MKPHGNSYQNTESHHLYVIFDGNDDSIYKFGISDDTIDAEGLSSRIKEQLDVFNRIAGSFVSMPGFYIETFREEGPPEYWKANIFRNIERNSANDLREI
jgi:hypothetical protein